MRNEVDNFQYVVETNKLMRKGGLLLVSEGEDDKPNAMTIGWGFLGTMWSKPVFIVAVRYSRYTYKLMEESDSFTVCLPSNDMEKALEFCGTKSGRDMDKLKDMGLSTKKGKTVDAPYIKESPVHYECKVVYKDEMEEGRLAEHLQTSMYKSKDWHVLYYGEVMGCYAVEDAPGKLMK
jgi:flavin reductase (DIM6/NTAB) family NADH-FMN oxidoreductase RutF